MLNMKPNAVVEGRKIKIATIEKEALGPLQLIPGTWANILPSERDGSNFKGVGTLDGQGQSPFDGRGWNLIALPFAEPNQFHNYRLLFNQNNEGLMFTKVDEAVPNRGITGPQPASQADQKVAALDYEQTIAQISSKDIDESDAAGGPELPIHYEPGFFLHMKEQNINGINIARLATIPHGNSATALSTARTFYDPPTVQDLSAFPEGVLDGDIVQAVEDASD